MEFSGKRVLVTGSTRGIGQALARRFHEHGARVAINGRTEDGVAASILKLGSGENFVPAVGDLSSTAGCEAAVGRALDG
ncbi:MAG: SDR family NAD(P)-dependent oxidoreductase, partial [Gammaproteobacteria bacterium]|nr:SDR family NAD(P)-dependent oxidoreductase [Gammaproteobacteria bacterium]